MTLENLRHTRFAFLGGGIIAAVLIQRMIQSEGVRAEQILASDIRPERLAELRQTYGISTCESNLDAAHFGDVLVLAVPPPAVKTVLEEIRASLGLEHFLFSLAAAIPTEYMESLLGRRIPVVRVIPNTPSLVGSGVNPYCLGKHVRREMELAIERFLGIFGEPMLVPEERMNTLTELTAVGPTYFFPVLKALKQAAVAAGLSDSEAQRAVAETAIGAARLMLETGRDPDELNLMIGTRTLDEEQTKSLVATAYRMALEKITNVETKLVRTVTVGKV